MWLINKRKRDQPIKENVGEEDQERSSEEAQEEQEGGRKVGQAGQIDKPFFSADSTRVTIFIRTHSHAIIIIISFVSGRNWQTVKREE